jgi:S1-C subfamily serine protease
MKTLAIASLVLLTIGLAEKPPTDARQLPAFEKQIQQTYERVSQSTVTLFGPGMVHKGSGVIIEQNGLILTHGHHELSPGTPMTIMIAGKQTVTGKLLGVHHYYDQSLIRLDAPGPYPAVPLGTTQDLQQGDAVLMLGFPKIYYELGRPPLVRLGRVLNIDSHQIMTSCRLNGGDSGGPLFNLKGELLGTNHLQQVQGEHGAGHPSVDCYRNIREQLLAGVEINREDMEGPFADRSALDSLATPARQSVVQVVMGNKQVALGLIVDSGGWIVTKGSAITVDQVVCKLADGRKIEASLAARLKLHDLALLKTKADGLIAATFADATGPKPGAIEASIGIETKPLSIGIVCSSIIEVPRERGQLAINLGPVEAGVAGVTITEVWPFRPEVARILKIGDIVTHINAQPTPDLDTFVKVRENQLDNPAAVVGDTLGLTIIRNKQAMQVNVPIESSSNQPDDEFRGRRSGFPSVFTHDGAVPRKNLGGPVVDSTGKVIGLNLASIWGAFTYALPADAVRKALDEMKAKAGN